MVIAKTASRNVAFKVARLGDSILDRQFEILMTEAATVDSPSQEDDFDDVGCNAELYASRQDAFQAIIWIKLTIISDPKLNNVEALG
jgi:hypothetical protein